MTVHCRGERFNMGDAEREREGGRGKPGPERKCVSEIFHLLIYKNKSLLLAELDKMTLCNKG